MRRERTDALASPSYALKASLLAALFATGGLLALLEGFMPSYRQLAERDFRLFMAAAALTGAGVIFLLRHRLGQRSEHAVLVTGVALVTVAVVHSSPDPSFFADALFYGWVLSLAFAFWPLRVALRYLGLVGVAFAAALAVHPRAEDGLAWLILMLSIGLPALVVGYLSSAIRRLALTDALTGLYNRRAYLQLLEQQAARSRRNQTGMAVAVLDLDDLKQINDQHGHAAGDQLLRRAADTWGASLREGDILARLGGDEFGLLLTDCADRERAAEVLHRVLYRSRDVSASIGAAIWSGESAETLLRRADQALYAAKAAGKNCIRFEQDLPHRSGSDAPPSIDLTDRHSTRAAVPSHQDHKDEPTQP